MIKIHKKLATDESGRTAEVVLPIEEYREIEEILGLDLPESELQSIRAAQQARTEGRTNDFEPLE